jgi:hypothetical protein
MRNLAALVVALVVAAPAAAASPRFALLDLHDLAHASKNAYGDVHPTKTRPRAALVVRCASGCRFGAGWLGFARGVGPVAGDVRSASATRGRFGWSVRLTLSPRGRSRWQAFARLARRHEQHAGVPDVLAVAVGGRIVAASYANDVGLAGRVLELPGFSRSEAKSVAKRF